MEPKLGRTSFYNEQGVHNQVGHQEIHGDVYHYTNFTTSDKRLKVVQDDTDTLSHLDDDILESLAFPQMTDRRRSIDIPHRQTCRWIFDLDEYRNWTAQPSGLLWIKGKPGAGKSTLMSQLYSTIHAHSDQFNHLSTDIFLEFFFNARGVLLERSALGMLRTLANQIFLHDPDVRTILRRPSQGKRASFGKVGWEWQRQELEILLSSMILASAENRQIVIFVDALDEAGESTARAIAHYFHDLNKRLHGQSGRAKICISCRHYPIPSKARAAIEIHVENHNHDDIAAYIRDYFEDYIDTDDLPSSDIDREGSDRQDLINELTNMADGLFQWARLVMPLMEKRMKDGSSIDQIRQWLLRIPLQLEQIYEYILNSVIEKEYEMKSFQLFRWVCLAMQPLSVTELRYALATYDMEASPVTQLSCHALSDFVRTDEVMKSRIKSWSGGLIEVVNRSKSIYSEETSMVQPIHLTVKTFWLARGPALSARLRENEERSTVGLSVQSVLDARQAVARSHGELYWSCLKYIASERAAFSSIDVESHDREEIHSMWDEMRQDRPFMEYAATFVIAHAREASDQRRPNLDQELQLLQYAVHIRAFILEAPFANKLYAGQEPHPVIAREGATMLRVLAAAGLTDLMQHAIRCGADVSARDKWGQTALHFASGTGRLNMVQILVAAGADIESLGYLGDSPLSMAAEAGHRDVFAWLLRQAGGGRPGVTFPTAVSSVARTGDTTMLNLCIKAAAQSNFARYIFDWALEESARQGHTRAVQMLLEAGADVNASCPCGRRALQSAATAGALEVVGILIGAGANVNARGEDDMTALQTASGNGDLEMVQTLLRSGTDVNARGGSNGTALQAAAAAKGDHVSMIQLLLRASAEVNAQGEAHGTALQAAAERGNVEIVEALLEAGAAVDLLGGTHGTALQAAASGGSLPISNTLLAAGADVNVQGGLYGNALQAAACMGQTEIVRTLIRAGADVNARGGKHLTALHAAAYSGNAQIVQALLDVGADVHAKSSDVGTVLQVAVDTSSLHNFRFTANLAEVVRLILDAGADVNARDGLSDSALQTAAKHYDERVIELLLRAGADANVRGGVRYDTALQAAAWFGYRGTVSRLLEAGADINAIGGEYGTALQAAASSWFRHSTDDLVRVLLDAGADVNAWGGKYGTALNAARRNGRRRVVEMLILAGAYDGGQTQR